MRQALLGGVGAVLLLTRSLAAQGGGDADCFPPKGSNEARTMAIFDVPLAFSAAAAPSETRGGQIRVGLDVSYLPKVDPATATPTICRPSKMVPEHTNFLFAVPRPRVRASLPAGFAVEASWLPPVRVSDVKANLFGIALERSTALNARGMVLGLRAHATVGKIEAPITCDDAALEDATSECYQGTRSNDAFRPNLFGIEAAVGWPLGRTIRPYIGVGYNHLAPRFRVNFTNQFGAIDRRRVTVDLDRGVLFAGATWNATPILELGGEIYSAPVDAVTGRVVARMRLGR